MTGISEDGLELYVSDKSIDLPHPAQTIVEHDDLVVVLLDSTGAGPPPQDNVWAFDRSGARVWKAESVHDPSTGENTYVHLRVEDDELWAGDWRGMDYRLDPATGDQSDQRNVR